MHLHVHVHVHVHLHCKGVGIDTGIGNGCARGHAYAFVSVQIGELSRAQLVGEYCRNVLDGLGFGVVWYDGNTHVASIPERDG